MLRLEEARALSIRAGREFPSPVRILDRALAKAGLSRRKRRQIIADLQAQRTAYRCIEKGSR